MKQRMTHADKTAIIITMIKIGLLCLEPHEKQFYEENLRGDFEPIFYDAPVNIRKLDPEIEVLSVFVDFNVTRDVIDLLPNLKLIVCRSTGYNNIDGTAASERGIRIANTPGYGASSVAEYTFALILMLSRKLPAILLETNSGVVDRKMERGWDLHGRTIGIIGLGSIGRGVAQIAYGFGMRILAFSHSEDEEFARQYKIEYTTDTTQLCRESDIVTLHIPYRPENHHFLSANLLEQMKPTALVVNTARGELLNTLQLARMLKDRKLGGAALDVVEDENYLSNPNALIDLAASGDEMAVDKLRHALAVSAMERMPNVIITNHNGYNTVEALQRINETTVKNIVNFYNNGKVDFV